MTPAFSRSRTRRRQGEGERPTFSESSARLMRPSACRLCKILRSMASSFRFGMNGRNIPQKWQKQLIKHCIAQNIARIAAFYADNQPHERSKKRSRDPARAGEESALARDLDDSQRQSSA